MTRYVRLLARNRDFTRLYVAQLISFAGDWFATVALLGLALELTGSSFAASLVLVLQVAPFFLMSPIAGVLADRLDRRRLLVASDFARAVVALGFLFARDASTLWIALLAVALLSAGAAFFEPTSSASLPNLVEPEDLPLANALIGSAWGTMLAVGAAIGGVVAVTLGREAAFLLDAASFLVSGLLIVGIRRPLRSHAAAEQASASASTGFFRAMGDGLALARSSRIVAALMISKATFAVGTGAVLLLAIFGSQVFRAGDVGIGVLFAARGLGALVGPFLGRAFAGEDQRGTLIAIAASLVGFLACYLLIPFAPSIWIAAFLVFGGHLGGGAQWMLSTYALQRIVPDAVRGRIFSFDYGLAMLAMAISTLTAGILAEPLGPVGTLFALCGAAAIVSAAWIAWTRPLWRRPASEAAAVADTVG